MIIKRVKGISDSLTGHRPSIPLNWEAATSPKTQLRNQYTRKWTNQPEVSSNKDLHCTDITEFDIGKIHFQTFVWRVGHLGAQIPVARPQELLEEAFKFQFNLYVSVWRTSTMRTSAQFGTVAWTYCIKYENNLSSSFFLNYKICDFGAFPARSQTTVPDRNDALDRLYWGGISIDPSIV